MVEQSNKQAEAIELLKQALKDGALPSADTGFAHSLLASYAKWGHLTDKQTAWAKKLVDGCVVNPDGTVSPAPVVEPPKVEVGDFHGVIELFKAAQQHLKYPKINLQLFDGSPIQLSLAGKSAKQPGTVNVTDGKSYGHNLWYGRVFPDGIFKASKKIDFPTEMNITSLLTELAKDPAQVAAAYGALSGVCCFCNSALTDPKSTEVGYGPVCAAHYHLPWGKYGMVTPKKFVGETQLVQKILDGPYTFNSEAGNKTPVVAKGNDDLPASASVTPAYMLSEVELDARMKDLFAKFEGDQEATAVLNKLRDRARMERENV